MGQEVLDHDILAVARIGRDKIFQSIQEALLVVNIDLDFSAICITQERLNVQMTRILFLVDEEIGSILLQACSIQFHNWIGTTIQVVVPSSITYKQRHFSSQVTQVVEDTHLYRITFTQLMRRMTVGRIFISRISFRDRSHRHTIRNKIIRAIQIQGNAFLITVTIGHVQAVVHQVVAIGQQLSVHH